MSYILGKNEGAYNNTRRFAFTNITTEDFTSAWDGRPITVKAGQTAEFAHYLADKLTNELVDKIIIGQAKLDEVTKNQPYYRSPIGMNLGVPAVRLVWEKQIVRELKEDEESPETQAMRAEIRQEILKDINAQETKESVTAALPASLEEFADLTKAGQNKPEKTPIKVKTIKK